MDSTGPRHIGQPYRAKLAFSAHAPHMERCRQGMIRTLGALCQQATHLDAPPRELSPSLSELAGLAAAGGGGLTGRYPRPVGWYTELMCPGPAAAGMAGGLWKAAYAGLAGGLCPGLTGGLWKAAYAGLAGGLWKAAYAGLAGGLCPGLTGGMWKAAYAGLTGGLSPVRSISSPRWGPLLSLSELSGGGCCRRRWQAGPPRDPLTGRRRT